MQVLFGVLSFLINCYVHYQLLFSLVTSVCSYPVLRQKPGFNRISDLADSNDISPFHIKQIGRKTHLLLVTRSSLISSFNHAHVFMNKYTLFAETQINDCYYKKLREQEEKYIEAKVRNIK